jgi:hypothetical protein
MPLYAGATHGTVRGSMSVVAVGKTDLEKKICA